MTTKQANARLARYGVTINQQQVGKFVTCTTTDSAGTVTHWYAGMTANQVVAAYDRIHGV